MSKRTARDRPYQPQFRDEDNYSREHNEWRTHVLLPTESPDDYMTPIWLRTPNGAVVLAPCVSPEEIAIPAAI